MLMKGNYFISRGFYFRAGDRRMAFLPLLLFGLGVNAHLIFGGDVKLNLNCNNDMENIICQFEAKNCSEYNLTINRSGHKEYSCPLQQCNNKCCCELHFTFTFKETFTVKVCRENKEVDVKTVDTTESFKAKTPTIDSVNGSNGNIEVRWKTNVKKWLNDKITAEVTVYKQGDMTDQVSINVTPAMDGDLQYHVINGKDLDPDTTYMIGVRSFTKWNKMYSDSSNVKPFETSSSSNYKVWALLLGLSVFAVLLCVFLFWSFVKLKGKWWDIYSEPKMTISHIINPRVITTIPPIEISVCVTEEEMSIKRLFPEIQEANQGFGCSQEMKNKNNSGSSDIFNQTYSLLLPNCSGQRKTDSLEVQSLTERFSGSLCSPNRCDMANNPDGRAHLFPAQQDGSSLVSTEMSHQWCDACPQRVSQGIFGDSNTTSSGEQKTGLKGLEMCCEKAFKHENPFYDCFPDISHSFLPMKTDFQPVLSKVEQPDALLLQKINAGFEHLLKKFPEETFKIPQPNFSPFTPGFINNTQNAQCRPGLLLPFLPMTSADKTIEVISDYHGV